MRFSSVCEHACELFKCPLPTLAPLPRAAPTHPIQRVCVGVCVTCACGRVFQVPSAETRPPPAVASHSPDTASPAPSSPSRPAPASRPPPPPDCCHAAHTCGRGARVGGERAGSTTGAPLPRDIARRCQQASRACSSASGPGQAISRVARIAGIPEHIAAALALHQHPLPPAPASSRR